MEARQILDSVREDRAPSNWHIWRLRRGTLTRETLMWALYAVVGFLLLIPAVATTFPGNFQAEFWKAALTILIYVVLGIMAFGSLFYLVVDARRLGLGDSYLLVMTPDDFLKVQPGRIVHVPMEDIAHVTLRGVKTKHAATTEAANDVLALTAAQGHTNRMTGFLHVRRQPWQHPELAFLDTRTQEVVVVATDNVFDELPALAEVLNTLVDAKERQILQQQRGTKR